jgi:hypothetical protein
VAWEGDIFLAPLSALHEEETSPAYQGFGRWRRMVYLPLSLERALEVQRDLRLCLAMPDVESTEEDDVKMVFCDLSEGEVTGDPFGLFQALEEATEALWEYVPIHDLFRRVTLSSWQRERLADSLEESLF